MSEGTLCPPLRFEARNSDGTPADGALLYSYYAGTSTALATYSDVGLTTANANPVECDSAGRAVVFLQPLSYKFILRASDGTLLYSQDNVRPWGAGLGSSRNTISGRITGVTATPVSDVTSATSIYFTPYKGNQIGLYDGTSWTTLTFSETSIALGSDTASTNYDLFAYSNSGTLALERVAWVSDTVRDTALTTQDGILVKSGATTRRYLGTYRTASGAAGHVNDSVLERGIWNYYYRVRRSLRVTESADAWTYTTPTFRQAAGSALNQVGIVVGVAESLLTLRVVGLCTNSLGAATVSVSIGEDSTTTAVSGVLMQTDIAQVAVTALPNAAIDKAPAIGYHYYTWLEYSAATGVTTWYGDVGNPTAQQMGMSGSIEG